MYLCSTRSVGVDVRAGVLSSDSPSTAAGSWANCQVQKKSTNVALLVQKKYIQSTTTFWYM